MATFTPGIEHTSLKKNKYGVWEIHWTEPAWSDTNNSGRALTRTYSCRTKDRRFAEVVRQEWLNASQHMAEHTTTKTVGDLIDAYIKDYCEPNDIRASQEGSLKPVRAYLGHLDLADLSSQWGRDYRADRSKQKTRSGTPVKDGTIRRELGALRRVLTWAHQEAVWPSNLNLPFIPLPPDSQPRKVYVPGTKEAQVHAQAVSDFMSGGQYEKIALFTLIALDAAARSEAIETLTLDRINMVQGYLDFRDPTRRPTKKRRAVVPIADRLRPILVEALARRKKDGSPYILGDSTSTLTRWKRYRVRLGIPGVNRHDLRRTFGTLATQSGVDIWEVAGVLADTVATTERNYAHHAPEFLKGAVNKRRGGSSLTN